MSQPYFEVGEEVILMCESNPAQHGEYVVDGVFCKGDIIKKDGRLWQCSDSYGYVLHPYKVSPWNQSALRKKHKPSDESFEEMMGDILSTITEDK